MRIKANCFISNELKSKKKRKKNIKIGSKLSTYNGKVKTSFYCMLLLIVYLRKQPQHFNVVL